MASSGRSCRDPFPADEACASFSAEGGPLLAGALLQAGYVDELFLTHATLLTPEPGARRLFGASEPLGREVRP